MGGRRSVTHTLSRVAVGAAALLVTGLVSFTLVGPAGGLTPSADRTGHVTADVAETYVPLSPSRITDTRTGSGYPNAGSTLGAGSSLNVQVTGAGAVPTTGVTAVVVNVTVVGPTASSYLTVFPEGTTQPAVSNVNFTPGQTLANLATVPLGSQGGVTVYNYTGRVNVVVDVEGYYTTTPQSSGLYNPVNPLRVLGADGAASLGAGASTAMTVAGVDSVPADASAVVANVTVAGSTGSGFLTAFPALASGVPAPPTASNVNFTTGQVIANRVIIPVGANGQIEVYNYNGSTKVDVDLDGYYTGSSGELGSAYTPMNPARVTDTRVGTNGSVVGPDASESFSFLSEGLSPTATALVANVTVVAGATAGYVTVYPTTESTPPTASDVNFTADSIAQNLTLAPLNGAITYLFNSGALPVNIIIDAFGFFSPPPPAATVTASPASVPAGGTTTSAINVMVTTGSGVAFNDPVTLITTPSVTDPSSCGTTTAPGSTNASGQVTSTYTPSITAGTCTITATEGNSGISGSVVITQT